MNAKNLFTIKFISIRTGLKPHVIRAWESRYAAVTPERTPTNRRLYCQKDLRKLLMLKMATEAGHQISRIAQASTGELRELLNLSDAPPDLPSDPPPADNPPETMEKDFNRTCLQAVVELDPDKLNKTLSEAAVHLTRQRWVEKVVKPLFQRIGELWSSGRLKILNEHMASQCARTIMGDMLRAVEITPNAPGIVVGTPVGQWHELGALAAALAAADAGWRPLYVGANLPAEELASAMKQFGAQGIGLSLNQPLNDNRLEPDLVNLRRYIGPDRGIIIGGLQNTRWDAMIHRINARRTDSWQELMNVLKVMALG